ncbi:lyase [Lithospermum erythrorhizon]|uniref:Lyase n=1 Tax=Lithospermum erythrorhizon TaxID=34254 RepID=A0AAV3PSW6_LITER
MLSRRFGVLKKLMRDSMSMMGSLTFSFCSSFLQILLLFLGTFIVQQSKAQYDGECQFSKTLQPISHSVSVLEFGAVGDGKTINTVAFQNAIFYLKSFADKGGAQLYVPAGEWLTGTLNLTSHLTLFLEKDAVILGSQDYDHWVIVDPLPSYGHGIEHRGSRYRSLITGSNLVDVVITGNNGTIDGQGSVWWDLFSSGFLNYSRPHLVEFIESTEIVVSNLTFVNAPAWSIRPAYCSNVLIQNITVDSPPESPLTSGVVPDSSDHVCIENSNISTSHDAVSLKSGWDEYGIAYGRPTTNIHIRGVRLQSSVGSGIAFGSEMSGGISHVLIEDLRVRDSYVGILLKTTRSRGGYIRDIVISRIIMDKVQQAIKATGQWDTHPDDEFDNFALPSVSGITFKDIIGSDITTAGNFTGISESPFTSFCLSNIALSVASDISAAWVCSDVSGSSENVSPEPCPELQDVSSACSFLSFQISLVAVI